MSGPLGSSQWMYATGAAVEGQSLRFNDDDSAYLSWTPAAAGNRKTWTWSGWVKRGNLPSSVVYLFGNSNGSNLGFHATFESNDTLSFLNYPSGISGQLITSRVFRDTNAWYHIVFVWDTTNATSGDRMRIYVNGERETAFGTASYPSLNLDGTWNSTSYGDHAIGRNNYNGRYLDGYLAEVNFIDGTALDPTSFGETNANGQWVPIKEPSVTYGTNGFYLPFTNDYEVEGFNTVTYRGTSTTHYVGGVGFEPDLVWIKNRGTTNSHNFFDSIRGAGYYLGPDITNAEIDNTAYFTGFEPDGFTMALNGGNTNLSGNSYVAWCWDAGTGSPASNTDGSITSTVKANPDYGQSIVSYTGTNSATETVGHGLSQAPDMVIVKSRDSAVFWCVYHSGVDATSPENYLMRLNTTDARLAGSAYFNNTAPTSSVFTIGTSSALNNTDDFIAYCFHSVAGYSDFGSYTGNGSSTGPTVTTGFKPAFLMVKRTDSSGYSWTMHDNTRDPYNPVSINSFANTSGADNTGYDVDFNSDGFQIKTTTTNMNASGGTYIYMAFADKREAAFWLDQSGNNNDWTNNNMQESDISLDSPTNNFATLNALANYTGGSLSEGNLRVSTGSTQYGPAPATFAQSSGKWYAEFSSTSTSGDTRIGAVRVDTALSTTYDLGNSGSFAYRQNDGNKKIDGTQSAYGATWAASDIIGIALNLDDNEVTFYKNNTSQGTFSITAGEYFIAISDGDSGAGGNYLANFGQDSSFAGNKVAQGNTDENGFGDFYYAPPAGYLALCTQNLPEPTILDGTEYSNTVTWTGTGASNSITGVGFQPDLVWTKDRGVATTAHTLHNVVSGVDKYLSSSRTNAESTLATIMTSFDSDGFTLGTHGLANTSGRTYVGWSWKAGGTGVANTDGSISSTVSANQTAGFSIVSYTGNGTSTGESFGHGLSQRPDMVIVKNKTTSGTGWNVLFPEFMTATQYMALNLSVGISNSANSGWGGSLPDSTKVYVGGSSWTNTSGNDYIAYCFHSVEGYSKASSFTGNGSTNGTFVYTGFKPAFILWKRTSSTSNWLIWDDARSPYNVVDKVLFPDIENAESTSSASYGIDMLSNGFKLRNSNATVNGSGSTYAYMAFAESPFKYSNAR